MRKALPESDESRSLRQPSSVSSRIAQILIIVIAAAVATAPEFLRGASCGHDFDFHLVSWFDCLSAWKQGVLYPHWAPSANYGAGEPRFIFYPPLTWMLGAALGALLPWTAVPAALTFLLLAATGLATRAFARRLIGDGAATLAGCAALFCGYALFTAYERTAFGELAGGFWIPLLLMFQLSANPIDSGRFRIRGVVNVNSILASLVLTGAWLSNAPLGVMASYLLAAIAIVQALLVRSWLPIARALLTAVLGVGLAAFYLVPAAYEQRWVDIRQAVDDPGERIENSFLFGDQLPTQLALHNEELHRVSWIGVSMIAVALAGFALALRRKTLACERTVWLPLALISVAVLLLQLPPSVPLWNLLPKLRFLQFPWRWLVIVEAPMAIFFVAAIWPTPASIRPSSKIWLKPVVSVLASAFFLSTVWFANRFFYQVCDDEDAVAPMLQVFKSGAGFQGTDEYAPPSGDNTLVATGLPGACLVSDQDASLGVIDTPGANPDWWIEQHSCDATYAMNATPSNDAPLALHLLENIPQDGFLILRLRAYPAWRFTLNDQTINAISDRDDGLAEIPLNKGSLDLRVQWTTTSDVIEGRWISGVALLMLIGLSVSARITRQPAAS